MKFNLLYLLALGIFLFSACQKVDEKMTDDELIEAIQLAAKQNVSSASLPEDCSSLLFKDFSESYVQDALLASGLGYELILRRGTGSEIGERSELYFNLRGRELRREKDRLSDRKPGEDGKDRAECFEMVFPISFVMPDGSEISGNKEEIRIAMKEWYEAHPDSNAKPELVFPVEIKFEDGASAVLNNYEELRHVYDRCKESDAAEFDCPELQANIGDVCYRTDRDTPGVINEHCECE